MNIAVNTQGVYTEKVNKTIILLMVVDLLDLWSINWSSHAEVPVNATRAFFFFFQFL
jgi:hypothetical protein